MLINLRETILSSLFFHLMLFLLMIAVSNYTTGFPEGIQKVISIDLAVEESKDQPAERSDSAEEQPETSSLPSDDATSKTDEAISGQPEESKNPEPEKKAGPSGGPAKMGKEENPFIHKKIFAQQAGARVNRLLSEAFKVSKQEFYGGTAIVRLTFGPDGKLKEVFVASSSPPLKAFLEEIGWGLLPPPAAYSLDYTEMQIEFAVLEGLMSFNINTR